MRQTRMPVDAVTRMSEADCIFCKIAAGAVPAEMLYDDGQVFAIADLNPIAPTHLLIIPHAHVDALAEAGTAQLDAAMRCLALAPEIARLAGVDVTGFRLVVNQGEAAGQVVPHFHMHLLAGRQLGGMG